MRNSCYGNTASENKKKNLTSSVYDCTVEDVEYICNSNSTLIDWACYDGARAGVTVALRGTRWHHRLSLQTPQHNETIDVFYINSSRRANNFLTMSVVTKIFTQTGMWNSVQLQTVNVPPNYVHTNTGKGDDANYAPQISTMQTLYESNKLDTRTKQNK